MKCLQLAQCLLLALAILLLVACAVPQETPPTPQQSGALASVPLAITTATQPPLTPSPTITPLAFSQPTITPAPPSGTANAVGTAERPGVLVTNNWVWHGLPMPANVVYLYENDNDVFMWINSPETAIVNWFTTNWLPLGYGRYLAGSHYLDRTQPSALDSEYCPRTATAINTTRCLTVLTHPTDRVAPGVTLAYPAGWTFVVVSDRRMVR